MLNEQRVAAVVIGLNCGPTLEKTVADLDRGADVVVIVHGDHQYSPKLAVPMAAMITCGLYDLVLGSRLLTQNPRDGGMPTYKYVANRALTIAENVLADTKVSDIHTGLRAFRASFLRRVPFEANSDTFIFDNEIVLQALAIGAPIGEVTCPTHYADDSSSIDFPGGVRYGLGVMRAGWRYHQWRHGRRRYPFLDIAS